MKTRRGFRPITLYGKDFVFAWASGKTGKLLILYDGEQRVVIEAESTWAQVQDSRWYRKRLPVWRGKYGSGARGKAEVAELYRKHLILTKGKA